MRSFWIFIFLFLLFSPFEISAQIMDSFDEEDINSNIWKGEVEDFRIQNGILRLDARSDKGRSTIWGEISDEADKTQINLDFKLNFNPSKQNSLDIWFIADDTDVDNAKGYFLSIGETGSDDAINVYQRLDNEDLLVAIGNNSNVAEKPMATLTIKKNTANSINIIAKYQNGSQEVIEFLIEPIDERFFIIDCHYTSSRSDEFFFDNFYVGPEIKDETPPLLTGFDLFENSILLHFNEALAIDNITEETFLIQPNIEIEDLSFNTLSEVLVQYNEPFLMGEAYDLEIKNIRDLSANLLDTIIHFSILPHANPSDIIVNEILFNPKGSGSDYVEIVNTTEQSISLASLFLVNTDNGQRKKILAPVEILPGEYLLFTEDKANTAESYPAHDIDQFYQQDLPGFNNDDGNVSIFKEEGGNSILIDGYTYTEKDHFLLLDEEDGVSLERIKLNAPTNDKFNWTSAAASVGFGTPGVQNSALELGNSAKRNLIEVTNKVFSPNGDGHDEEATISYELAPGYIGNASIYDLMGREIKRIWQNVSLSTRGEVKWDGKNEDDNIALEGIYIVVVELFNLEGDTFNIKEELVLAQN